MHLFIKTLAHLLYLGGIANFGNRDFNFVQVLRSPVYKYGNENRPEIPKEGKGMAGQLDWETLRYATAHAGGTTKEA